MVFWRTCSLMDKINGRISTEILSSEKYLNSSELMIAYLLEFICPANAPVCEIETALIGCDSHNQTGPNTLKMIDLLCLGGTMIQRLCLFSLTSITSTSSLAFGTATSISSRSVPDHRLHYGGHERHRHQDPPAQTGRKRLRRQLRPVPGSV